MYEGFVGHFWGLLKYFLFEMSSLKSAFYLKKKSSKSLQELLDSSFLVSTGDECGDFCGDFLSSGHKFDNYVAYVFSL